MNPNKPATCSPTAAPRLPRKPRWLKVRAPGGENYTRLKGQLRSRQLNTVCEEARCPNIGECWGGGTLTVMLLGDTCTRACRFCAVKTGNPKGVVDGDEPENVAAMLAGLGLEYVVLTMVDRDDLADGGAAHVARTLQAIRRRNPGLLLETLVGDFLGKRDALSALLEGEPDVFAHNIEVTERLTREMRDKRCNYRQSLDVLRISKELRPDTFTKSSIMVGIGESREEVEQCLHDLRGVGVDFVTIGQYLQPTARHHPVIEYVHPDVFESYRQLGASLGFQYTASGPLVRSSYRAAEFFIKRELQASRGRSES